MPLPRIIVTSGEPAGIGPDLCIAMVERQLARELRCELVFAGDRRLFGTRARELGRSIAIVDYPNFSQDAGVMTVANVPTATPVSVGHLDSANARYVLNLLDLALQGCRRGEFTAMVTAPVQKSVIADAGFAFTGHTEYLAEQLGAPLPVMMLVADTLRVALATTHLPLARVPAAITRELLIDTLCILDRDLRERFAIERPRILVLGLNPHAGESGHLGREEIEILAPTVESLRAQGLTLIGPAPADTAFTPRMLKNCDVVLAMYHDQGLPVLKYAGFGHAVNVTLGLPIVRTSVDHGTALELAGSGKADAGSLEAAIRLAVQLSRRA